MQSLPRPASSTSQRMVDFLRRRPDPCQPLSRRLSNPRPSSSRRALRQCCPRRSTPTPVGHRYVHREPASRPLRTGRPAHFDWPLVGDDPGPAFRLPGNRQPSLNSAGHAGADCDKRGSTPTMRHGAGRNSSTARPAVVPGTTRFSCGCNRQVLVSDEPACPSEAVSILERASDLSHARSAHLQGRVPSGASRRSAKRAPVPGRSPMSRQHLTRLTFHVKPTSAARPALSGDQRIRMRAS
jgi:hypothetical protein